MALTEVRHVLLDAGDNPRTGVKVTATLIAPYGYLTGTDDEVVDPIVGVTDDAGRVSLLLIPTGEYVWASAVYRIDWDGLETPKYITVPAAGPVNLADWLTTPPAAGPVSVPVAGAAGRGIASTTYNAGTGLVTVNYTDALNPSTFTMAQGTPGAGGPTGTASVLGAPVVGSAAGAGTSKFGHQTWDMVDRFGADPTGVASSSAALTSAITAATAFGGALLVWPEGTFLMDSATRPVLPGDVGMLGAGSGSTTLSFTHLEGGLSLGVVQAGAILGGSLRFMTLDGNDTTRTLLRSGHIAGWGIHDLELKRSGYDATSQATKDVSAAWLQEQTLNLDISNLRINVHQGHGIIADRGSGGHQWTRGRIATCGSAGADVHNLWMRNTTPGGDPYAGVPSDWTLANVFIESASAGQTILTRIDSCNEVRLRIATTAGALAGAAVDLVKVGASANQVIFDGASIAGSFSGNSTASMVGVRVVLGAQNVIFSGHPTKFSNIGTGMNIENGPTVLFTVAPIFTATAGVSTVTTRYAGTPSRITNAYGQRYNSTAPQVASDQNRGVQYFNPGAGGVADRILIPMKTASGAYEMKDPLAPPAPVVQTEATVGTAKTVAAGQDIFNGELTASAGATITVPAAVPGFVVLRLKHTGPSGTRPWTLAAPGGTTIVGDPDATALTGDVAAGKQTVVVLSCFAAGAWSVKVTSRGVPVS